MTTENIEQNESNQNIDSYTKLLNEFSESREKRCLKMLMIVNKVF